MLQTISADTIIIVDDHVERVLHFVHVSIEWRGKLESLQVFDHLSAYYRVQQRVDRFRLIIVRGLGIERKRIQSYGEFLDFLVSVDGKERKLRAYQYELHLLTIFLRSSISTLLLYM